MNKRQWFWLLPPVGLALAGVMLLVRVNLVDAHLFFPEDFDIIFILFGLSVAIFSAITLILREGLERLRLQSVEQARKETHAEHRRFLRRLDHELKNPLTALRAGLGSLSLTLTEESQCDLVETMASEAYRLSRLVSDLRKLAELESTPPDASLINIEAFFAEIIDLEHERIDLGERQFILQLSSEISTASPLIGDQDLLLLAVHNLLDNAFKYTDTGDSIRLQVFIEDDDLIIQIHDTGIGIPESEISLVWEELYRGRNAQNISGNGIGLALVKAVVDRHYGTVNLVSQPNNGTIVTLRLPLL